MTLVVFDVDGTIANIEHRRAYVRTKPKNWKAFEAGIPNDDVNLPVAEVFRQLVSDAAFTDVVLASGRSEKYPH
jgi:hydroxymethylpyrimidine pyrophosphatase-like HAD family hydrolase